MFGHTAVLPSKAAQSQFTATGRGGAAASTNALGTAAALEILAAGGNAVDAAVAAAAVLGVVEPYSCGIGGGGFMLVYLAGTHQVVALDHRETAPAALTIHAFRNADGTLLPSRERITSGMAAGVPGTVRGWEEAVQRYGRRSLAEALQPAIRIAQDGFVVDEELFAETRSNQARFRAFDSTQSLFLDAAGNPPAVGTVLRNPDLAATYRRIAREGSAAFYRGPLADAIVDAVQEPPLAPDATLSVRPGLMTRADLESYAPIVRAPLVSSYRGFTIYSVPPPSGGVGVALGLNLLAAFDLAALPRPDVLHLYLEASRLAHADRNAYIGDPEYVNAPLAGLFSPEYADARRRAIPERAPAAPQGAGDPFPFQGGAQAGGSTPDVSDDSEDGSTTHLTVADAEGNVVSYTFTLQSIGGNAIVVPGGGFLLNNQMSTFGFSATSPNAAVGGKRPRSSISPTLVFRDGEPVYALGSPGGNTIMSTVLQLVVNLVDFQMELPEAVAALRLSQRNAATTQAEPDFLDAPEAEALLDRGHRFEVTRDVFGGRIGDVAALQFHADGRVTAAAERVRRGGGVAQVVRPD
jgi:gamma-glutamyltranspeptidase/glutathione hydrolase